MLRILILLLASVSLQAQSVYKTPSGEKYHLASCRHVNNVAKKMTIEEAVKIGLQPCKICKPPGRTTAKFRTTGENKEKGEGQAVQCQGITKARNRCKRTTRLGDGYCFQHNPGSN